MAPLHFEFRLCQNPDCGLRYPAQRGDRRGLRCPICLSATTVVAERTAPREDGSRAAPIFEVQALECLLDNVRSALNVGSIFRTAEGYSFGHVYLCGITPTPENPRLSKTGLSAEQSVPWTYHRNAVELLASLRGRGCRVWALERTSGSRDLQQAVLHGPAVDHRIMVLGNEQAGVDPGILEIADEVVHLEMKGSKHSFNVAVAFAIAAHILSRSGE